MEGGEQLNIAVKPTRKGISYLPQLVLFVLLVALGWTWGWWVYSGDWLIQVNGTKISSAELNAETSRMEAFLQGVYGIDFTSEQGKELKEQLRQESLQNLIDRALLGQAAVQAGIKVDSAAVEAQLMAAQMQAGGMQNLEKILKAQGLTIEDYRNQVVELLTLQQLQQAVTGDVTVEEQEIQKIYKEQSDQMILPERVQVGHILLETEEQAVGVIKKLKEGADFQGLAVEKSIDPSVAQNKGILGYLRQDDPRVAAAFKEEAFRLQKGKFSQEPVKTEYGYHVLYCFDKKAAGKAQYDEVKDGLKQGLLVSKKNEAFQSYLENLRNNSSIMEKPDRPLNASFS